MEEEWKKEEYGKKHKQILRKVCMEKWKIQKH